MKIRKGDPITILPQFQDPGDETFKWVAADDEEKGRVTIRPLGTGLNFPPLQTVRTDWITPTKNP